MASSTTNYEQTKNVYEEIASKYLKGTSNSFPAELSDFISLLSKDSRVLDVGTAGGRDANVFIKAGMRVVGTDVVESFLKEARKNVPEAVFVNKDMRNLDFDDGSFDAIWANAVLLHAERSDIPQILNNFYRILTSGGKIHVRVKEGTGEAHREEKLSDGKKRFFVYYSQPEFERLFKEARFHVIRSQIIDDERGRSETKWISIWGQKP